MRVRAWAALAVAAVALPACSTFGGKDDEKSALDDERVYSILTLEQELVADAELAGRAPLVPEPQTLESWPQPGGPPTNAPPPIAVNGELKVLWKKSVGEGSRRRARVVAPPIVADGKVFVMDADQRVRALSAANGSALWSVELEPREHRDRVALAGGLAYSDGKLYAASGYGFTVQLDANNGQELWRAESPTPLHAAPTVANGRVFVVNTDGELVVMDQASGAMQWSYQAISEPARILSASSPAVLDAMVVAPFASGEIVALLPGNGRRLWVDALTRSGRLTSLSSINDVAGRPVAYDGVIYAASHSGVLAAIDSRSGQRIWYRDFASTQTPFVAGDALYAVTVDGELAAIERATGKAFWVTQLRRYRDEEDKKGRIAWAGPLMLGGKLALVSSRGELSFVDPLTGNVERTIDIGGPVYIPPVSAGGRLYLLTDEATLVVLG